MSYVANGVEASFTEYTLGNGRYKYVITEGNTTDVLIVSEQTNVLTLNNSPVLVCQVYSAEPVVSQSSVNSTNTTWIKMGNTSYFDITTERAISTMTTSILLAILTSFISSAISITISVCSAIITAYKSTDPDSKYLYVSRALYYDKDIPNYHFLEKMWYYRNSNYTGLVTTSQKEHDSILV